MKANRFHAYVLAGLITLFAPLGQSAAVQAAPPAAAPVAQAAKPAAAAKSVDAAKVSAKVREQAGEKDALRERLKAVKSAGAARPGEAVDRKQASIGELIDGGAKLEGDTVGGFAYVQRYVEPNDQAHRNYCGPGAAAVVISHFQADMGQVDIDELGEAMNMDPGAGVWVKDITEPVNDQVNRAAGQDLNWYRYGDATTIDDLRFMLDYDIRQNGVPLITSLETGDLPGWKGQDVGHIVAVYGYYQDASGKEFVSYADTAPAVSGYEGKVFNTVELTTFWEAVSGNSAQVW